MYAFGVLGLHPHVVLLKKTNKKKTCFLVLNTQFELEVPHNLADRW